MDKDFLRQTLQDMLEELENGQVRRYDDYSTLFPPEFGEYQWQGEAEKDPTLRGSYENILAVEAIAHPSLHPLMRQVVEALIELSEANHHHPHIWENEEEQAGGCLARELALYSQKNLPLYLRYIQTNDLDHEVYQMDDMLEIFDKWDYGPEIWPILLHRGEFGQNKYAYDDLTRGICQTRQAAEEFLQQGIAYFKENWDFTETDDEEDEDLEELYALFAPVFEEALDLDEERMLDFLMTFNNTMAQGETPTLAGLLQEEDEATAAQAALSTVYKIAVVTGTRAEYGLLRPVLLTLVNQHNVQLKLLVTGAHLSANFGNTITEIEADWAEGITIDETLDILSRPVLNGRLGTVQQVALALQGCADYFAKIQPDLVLVLGDRYEIFAAAQAAALLNIPVAHISGGDVTQGADDDWFRHSITKMAKLHFTSCEAYRQRVIRMGEPPHTVLNVGALGDENIRKMPLLPKQELAQSLGMDLSAPYALVTFHPETLSEMPAEQQAREFLGALAQVPELTYIFTKANADAGGVVINRLMEEYCGTHANAKLFSSLGVARYLSAMKYAAVVLGNSSSGVVESPSFGVPCVNVGNRQTGRLMSGNILCCPLQKDAIAAAILQAVGPGFTQNAAKVHSPYNGGDTSGKIVSALLKALQDGQLAQPKQFYDGEDTTCTF